MKRIIGTLALILLTAGTANAVILPAPPTQNEVIKATKELHSNQQFREREYLLMKSYSDAIPGRPVIIIWLCETDSYECTPFDLYTVKAEK